MSQFNARPSFRFPKQQTHTQKPPAARTPGAAKHAADESRHAQPSAKFLGLDPAETDDVGLGKHNEFEDEDMLRWEDTVEFRVLARAHQVAAEAEEAEEQEQEEEAGRATPQHYSKPQNSVKRRRVEDDTPSLGSTTPQFNRPLHNLSSSIRKRTSTAAPPPTFNSPRPFHAIFSSSSQAMPPPTSMHTSRPRFIIPSTSLSTSPRTIDDNRHPDQPAGHAATADIVAAQPLPARLPDIFSPHKRKHERFIPGGWAAQVRGWLLDVQSSAGGLQMGNTSSIQSRTGDEEVEFEIADSKVADAPSVGGVVALITSKSISLIDEAENLEKDLLLVGDGGGSAGSSGSVFDRNSTVRSMEDQLGQGKKVRIGRPAWDLGLVDEISCEQAGDVMHCTERTWLVCPVWRAL